MLNEESGFGLTFKILRRSMHDEDAELEFLPFTQKRSKSWLRNETADNAVNLSRLTHGKEETCAC